jgi:hypothetical protein
MPKSKPDTEAAACSFVENFVRGQGSKKKFRGQGSAKNCEKALRGKPRKKGNPPRAREKAPQKRHSGEGGSAKKLREKLGEGSAKTEGSGKTEGFAKAPQNLCGSSSKAPRKTLVMSDGMLSMLRKSV